MRRCKIDKTSFKLPKGNGGEKPKTVSINLDELQKCYSSSNLEKTGKKATAWEEKQALNSTPLSTPKTETSSQRKMQLCQTVRDTSSMKKSKFCVTGVPQASMSSSGLENYLNDSPEKRVP